MEHSPEDRVYFSIDKLEDGFAELMVECVNAIDETDDNYRVLEDGRGMFQAEWKDHEDMYCYLRAFSRKDPATVLLPPDKQKFRTDYFFSRETSLPHIPNQKFYFTSVRQKVEICDESGVGIPDDDSEINLKHLTIVLKSLYERPTRPKVDDELKSMVVDFLIDHDLIVKSLIRRIDHVGRHAKNRTTLEMVTQYISEKEPIVASDRALVVAKIEAARTDLKAA